PRFFLAPHMGDAVRRYVELAGADVRTVITNSDFQSLGSGRLWLPRTSRVDWHSWPSRPNVFRTPIVLETLTVQQLDQKPQADEMFTLQYEAGLQLRDNRPQAGQEVPGGVGSSSAPAP